MGGWANALWQWILHLDGTHLFESAVVALAGAFFGAKTAQRTADDNRFRTDITKEIRDTNAAIALSFAISNSVMAIKGQRLRELKGTFAREKSALIEYERKRRTGEIQGNAPYKLTVDLRYLATPNLPTDKLQAHVLDRLLVVGRPLNLVVTINELAAALRESIASRNEQIKAFRADKEPRGRDFMLRYFGIRNGDGELDEIYATTLDAIVLHADSLIYLTAMLCRDLKDHGDELLSKYKQRLGRNGAPAIVEVDFSPARAENMIPPDDEFKTWNTAFVKRPRPLPRWRRVILPLRTLWR